MMATQNSQYISLLQNPSPVDYIGSCITLVSKYGLRYEGFLFHLNHHDKTLCLLNVACYGTEGRNYVGLQIPPSYERYSYIVFTTTQIKNVVVPARLARGGLSSKIYCPLKPPLPYKQGTKICQKVALLISNEKLSKTEAITDDYDAGLQIACKPLALQQYPGSNYYGSWSNHVYQYKPCAALYQDPTPSWIVPGSFFTTTPPVPISLRPGNGGFDFEALTKNFKPYKLWGPQRDINQEDLAAYTSYLNEIWNYQDYYNNQELNYQGNNNQEDQTAYTTDGSFSTNSRNPFDPIGRPWNPFGPIARPFSYLPSSHELADLGFV